jgi:hypothetical protein
MKNVENRILAEFKGRRRMTQTASKVSLFFLRTV